MFYCNKIDYQVFFTDVSLRISNLSFDFFSYQKRILIKSDHSCDQQYQPKHVWEHE